jgi:aspartate-semialdehyde dehydrogenase
MAIPKYKVIKDKYHEENFTSFDVQGAGEILIGNHSKSRTGQQKVFQYVFLGENQVTLVVL